MPYVHTTSAKQITKKRNVFFKPRIQKLERNRERNTEHNLINELTLDFIIILVIIIVFIIIVVIFLFNCRLIGLPKKGIILHDNSKHN